MTIKETYSLGNDADCWVDIPLETFQAMRRGGYSVQYTSLMFGGWLDALGNDYAIGYDESRAPFRTKHSEYMRYINRMYPMREVNATAVLNAFGPSFEMLDSCPPSLAAYRTRPDQGEGWIEFPLMPNFALRGDTTAPGVRTARNERKSRPDLLPSKAVLAAGRVLAFGLSKHPDEKWKTLSVADHVAACTRHLFQHQDGPDEETGESHLAHALCRIAFAIARDSDEGSGSE